MLRRSAEAGSAPFDPDEVNGRPAFTEEERSIQIPAEEFPPKVSTSVRAATNASSFPPSVTSGGGPGQRAATATPRSEKAHAALARRPGRWHRLARQAPRAANQQGQHADPRRNQAKGPRGPRAPRWMGGDGPAAGAQTRPLPAVDGTSSLLPFYRKTPPYPCAKPMPRTEPEVWYRTRTAGGARSAPRSREQEGTTRARRSPRVETMRIDLHCHTEVSRDPTIPVAVVPRRWQRAIRVQATDHTDPRALSCGSGWTPSSDPVILIGEEITTSEGEIYLFLTERIEAGLSPAGDGGPDQGVGGPACSCTASIHGTTRPLSEARERIASATTRRGVQRARLRHR